jgi:hypothetical protein
MKIVSAERWLSRALQYYCMLETRKVCGWGLKIESTSIFGSKAQSRGEDAAKNDEMYPSCPSVSDGKSGFTAAAYHWIAAHTGIISGRVVTESKKARKKACNAICNVSIG